MSDCPGRFKCHGPVNFCEECGDVDLVCDDPHCMIHWRGAAESVQDRQRGYVREESMSVPDMDNRPTRTCRSMHTCKDCGEKITYGQRYRDGGYGKRSHVECAEGQESPVVFRDCNVCGISLRNADEFEMGCSQCGHKLPNHALTCRRYGKHRRKPEPEHEPEPHVAAHWNQDGFFGL